ncbi:MAG: hypothetical protein L6R37_002983 [Teloschistes peruensis]|nr:MAG: hypothetical protein L6R37_002983 [Teloschistes peruensis]
MAASDQSDLFESQVFAIVAGPSEKVLYAHANILAKSVVLKRLVEGQFKESNEQRIIWPHWNSNTVQKFLEWLYKGDYKCPYPMIIPRPMPEEKTAWEDVSDASSATAEEEPKESLKRDIAPPIPKQSSKSSPIRFHDLEWNGPRCPTRVSHEEEYTNWIGHVHYPTNELDYERTFMTHAELYAMGCQYLLDDLRAMAWQRLKNALLALGVPFAGSKLIANITTVIHYVYEQTEDLPEGKEQMRNLLTCFATDHFEQIKKSSAFHDLLISPSASDREFVADLMAKVGVKLERLEAKIEEQRETLLVRDGKLRAAEKNASDWKAIADLRQATMASLTSMQQTGSSGLLGRQDRLVR